MNISQENILKSSIITEMDLKSSAASGLKASLNGLMFDSIIDNHMLAQAAVNAPKTDNFSTVNATDKNRSDINTDLDNNRKNSDYGQVERNFEKPAASDSSKDKDSGYDKASINTKGRADTATADTKGISDVQQSDDVGASEKNAIDNIEEINSDNFQNADKVDSASPRVDEALSKPLDDGLLVKILGSLAEETIYNSEQADDVIEISGMTEESSPENNGLLNIEAEQSELLLSNIAAVEEDAVIDPDSALETSKLNNDVFDDAVYQVIKDKALNEDTVDLEKSSTDNAVKENVKTGSLNIETPDNGEMKSEGHKQDGPKHAEIAEGEVMDEAVHSEQLLKSDEGKGKAGSDNEGAENESKIVIDKSSPGDKKMVQETSDDNGPDASEVSNKDNYKVVENRFSEKPLMTNGLDMHEAGDDAVTMVSRFMSGLVANAERENGLNTGKGNIVSQVRSVTGNTGTAPGAADNMIHANGATVQIKQTPAFARPSALNEIVDKIVYSVKGENNLGVTVKHEQLGNINIRLSLENGMVNVHINAQDRAAREMLESSMQELVNSLEENGVSVGGFSVALQNNGNNKGYQSGNNKGYSGGGHIKGESDTVPVQANKARGLVSILA